jgi:hypothetical protein
MPGGSCGPRPRCVARLHDVALGCVRVPCAVFFVPQPGRAATSAFVRTLPWPLVLLCVVCARLLVAAALPTYVVNVCDRGVTVSAAAFGAIEVAQISSGSSGSSSSPPCLITVVSSSPSSVVSLTFTSLALSESSREYVTVRGEPCE